MGCLYSKEGLSPTDNDPGASYAPPKPGALHGHPPALPGALETPKGGTRHGAHGPKPLPRPAQQPSADAHRRPRNSTSEGQRSSRQKSARPSHEPQRHISDTAEDGDWDNCETVFNLDDVEEAQIGGKGLARRRPSAVGRLASALASKALVLWLFTCIGSMAAGLCARQAHSGVATCTRCTMGATLSCEGCVWLGTPC
eukprot:evm.model.scf_441EXC.2 EVM.evm.TU.scf_441EXC.2   scf_441EXC:5085-6599(-)